MVNPRRTLLALVAGCTLAAAGCADVTAVNSERDDRREFPFSGDRLAIESDGTDVRLVPGDGDFVTVDRHLTGKATKGDNASWSLTGDTLRLNVTCSGFVPDCGARHIVTVPATTTLQVTSRGGAVRSAGFRGDLTVDAEGWLRVEDPAGTLRLTAEMNIDVTGARSAEVTATSEEQDVTVAFAAPPRRVAARAQLGSVDVTLPDGPETYRVTGTGLASDPKSARTVTAVADQGRARVRKAA